jgi:hypothetical protein
LQPFHGEVGKCGQFVARVAGREDQADGIGCQPAGHEDQGLRRRAIQPLLVIYQADQRPLPGYLRQQAQDGQAHQEPVRRRAGAEAERGLQRIPLRRWQTGQPLQHRRTQLMQPGERQLHLRLNARGPCYLAARRMPG